jgi:antitoxin (DNA-binding transcriptional repressor) of toxin-antitoxin stability system
MVTIDVHVAEMNLARLLEAAAAGEEIVIARGGKPLAKLVPFPEAGRPKRRLGALAGRARIPPEFDEPLPEEVLDAFEGR